MTCVVRIALVAFAAAASSAPSVAQPYPSRPVRLVVPFPAGGPNDIIGRLVAQKLGESFGQQVVVENRSGAGGNIGTDFVAKAAPDGHTLLSGGMGSLVMNPLIEKVPYNPLRDFAPVALVASAPNVLVVHPSLPVRDVKGLVALARARPGQLNYGSGGVGSTPHLSGALFNALASVDIVHVPYKGNAPALTDLLGGQVQLAYLGIPPVQPYLHSGRLRAVAVTSLRRSAAMKNVPTVAESGVSGYELSPWYGLLAPAGTPAEIVSRLNAEVVRAMRSGDMIEKLAALGAEPETTTPEEYAARLRNDVARWREVIRSAKITAQ